MNAEENLQRKPCKQPRTSKHQVSVCVTINNNIHSQQIHGCHHKNIHPGFCAGFDEDVLRTMLGASPDTLPTSVSCNQVQQTGTQGSSDRIQQQQQQQQQRTILSFQNMLKHLQQENSKNQADSPSLNQEQWKQIHGFLVLYLGNVDIGSPNGVASTKNAAEMSGSWALHVLRLLCQCLKEVYCNSDEMFQHNIIHTREELTVVSAVLIQHASRVLALDYTCRDRNACAKHLQEEAEKIMIVSTILDLLRMMARQPVLDVKTSEELNVILVRLICDFDMTSYSSLRTSAKEFLHDLTLSEDQKIATTANISTAAVADILNEPRGTLNLSPPGLDEDDAFRLTYWRRLAQSKRGATCLAKNLSILDKLVLVAVSSLNEDKGNSKCAMAVECVCLIAVYRESETSAMSMDQDPDWVMDALLRVLTGAQDFAVARRAIPGLKQCKPNKVTWQDSRFLEKVLSSLSAIAMDRTNLQSTIQQDHRASSAMILLDIVEAIVASPTQEKAILSYRHCMTFVAAFLHRNCDSPVLQELAIDFLDREATRISVSELVHWCPTIVNRLGALVCRPCSSWQLKTRIMHIFESLTRQEDSLGILARQCKVLEAVVIMASAPDNNSQNRAVSPNAGSRHVALIVLMRLAQNVCNRRILAKQVGVLACMIRHARSLSDQQQRQQVDIEAEQDQVVCLKDLKQKIMELAVAI